MGWDPFGRDRHGLRSNVPHGRCVRRGPFFNIGLMENQVDNGLKRSERRWSALNESAAESGRAFGHAGTRRVDSLAGRRTQAWTQRTANLVLIFSDIVLALAVWGVAILIRDAWGRGLISDTTIAGVLPNVAVVVVLRAVVGLYPGYGKNAAYELRRQSYATLGALTIASTGFVVLKAHGVGRVVLIAGFLALLIVAPLVRQLVKWRLKRARLWGKPVVVFASGEQGSGVAALLERQWGLGYDPAAVFASHPGQDRSHYEATPDEDSLQTATLLSRKFGIDTVIFAMPQTGREHLARLVHWASFDFRHVTVVPNLDGIVNSAAVARDLGGVFGVEIRYNLLDPWARRIKRALDLFAIATGGVFALPLLLVLCLLVRLESGGPVLYTDKRMGRNGEHFPCLKFRTMISNAEDELRRILEEDPEARAEYARYHKLREDPRVTRVGRFLRKTSLDELPQLWNVLKGEMSLVGPRPYLPRESEAIGATQSDILRVYPGMTGPWQVSGRSNTSFEDRVRMDAHYVRNWSIWLDLVLLTRTVKALVSERSAF